MNPLAKKFGSPYAVTAALLLCIWLVVLNIFQPIPIEKIEQSVHSLELSTNKILALVEEVNQRNESNAVINPSDIDSIHTAVNVFGQIVSTLGDLHDYVSDDGSIPEALIHRINKLWDKLKELEEAVNKYTHKHGQKLELQDGIHRL